MANQRKTPPRGGGKSQNTQKNSEDSAFLNLFNEEDSELAEKLEEIKEGSLDDEFSSVGSSESQLLGNTPILPKMDEKKESQEMMNNIDLMEEELMPDSVFVIHNQAIKDTAMSFNKWSFLSPLAKPLALRGLKKFHLSGWQANAFKYYELAERKANQSNLVFERLKKGRNTIEQKMYSINRFKVEGEYTDGTGWHPKTMIEFGLLLLIGIVITGIGISTTVPSIIANSGFAGDESMVYLWSFIFVVIGMCPKFLHKLIETEQKKKYFLWFLGFLGTVCIFTFIISFGLQNPSVFTHSEGFSLDFGSSDTQTDNTWAKVQQISQLLAELCLMSFVFIQASDIWARHWKVYQKNLVENENFKGLNESLSETERELVSSISKKNYLKYAQKVFKFKKKQFLSLIAIEFEKHLNSIEERDTEDQTIN